MNCANQLAHTNVRSPSDHTRLAKSPQTVNHFQFQGWCAAIVAFYTLLFLTEFTTPTAHVFHGCSDNQWLQYTLQLCLKLSLNCQNNQISPPLMLIKIQHCTMSKWWFMFPERDITTWPLQCMKACGTTACCSYNTSLTVFTVMS